MIFRTKIEIPIYDKKITAGNKLFFIGSCFADNIGSLLKNNGMNCTVNPYGTTYNPMSVCAVMERIAEGAAVQDDEVLTRNGLWYSFMHHTLYYSETKEQLTARINSDNVILRQKLEKSDFLFITLGTAWVYENLETGKIVNNCHKLPANRFRRYRLTIKEIVDAFSQLFSTHPVFKDKNIIFTVSPVRHLKDGMEGNSLSKAVLRVAVDELCSAFPNVSYFPAYEIMNDDLRDYRFYDKDMVHPSETAVEYIFGILTEALADNKLKIFLSEYGKLQKATTHRPFNAESAEYAEFRKKCMDKALKMQKDFPETDISLIIEKLI